MIPAIFTVGILAVMNGAKYQSMNHYLHLTYGYPMSEVALLFSLSNLCGLTFGLLMLSWPAVRAKFSQLHLAVLTLQATAYILSLLYRDVYAMMLIQRVLEGFVFAYIMNFYPVALTRSTKSDRTEIVMCMWGLVYALGFAFSNGIATLPIQDEITFNLPSIMLFVFLLVFNKRVIQAINEGDQTGQVVKKISLLVIAKIGMVAIPFFLFTLVYNNFLFTYTSERHLNNPLYWMMLINGAGIIISNLLISSRKLNSTFYLAFLIVGLWAQSILFSPSALFAAAAVIFVLGLIEGVVFGFFVRHFATSDFDLVKAGYLVSGSLGATLGPLFSLHFGNRSSLLTALFLTAFISLILLNETTKRSVKLCSGEDNV